MKKVFNNSEIMHVWANNLQNEGRTSSGSIFFNGNKIYSYGHHFCMAHRLENGTILFNSRSYSNTTSKHKSTLRSALSHKTLVFCPFPDDTSTRNSNFNRWETEARQILDKLKSARKPEKYISELQHIQHECEKFANTLELTIPLTLVSLFSVTSTSEAKQIIDNYQRDLIKEANRVKRAEKIEYYERVAKFMNNELPRIYSKPANVYDFMVVSGDEIKTTQGVQMPVEIVRDAFNRLISGKLTTGQHVGQYTIEAVNKAFVKVGCHTFRVAHINKILNAI